MSEEKHEITGDNGGGKQVSMPVNLPSNSHKSKKVTVTDLKSAQTPGKVEKQIEKDRPKLEKIIEGKASVKKKGFWYKAREAFTGDDSKSVGQYIMIDVIIPAIKDMLLDGIQQGSERLIMGPDARGGHRQSRNRPGERDYVPYGQMSTRQVGSGANRRRELSPRARATHDFRDVVVETRRDAEDIIAAMMRRIDDYGSATVADLYDLVDISGDFTDDKWGWYDLRDSGVRRHGGGYVLVLPKPEVIE